MSRRPSMPRAALSVALAWSLVSVAAAQRAPYLQQGTPTSMIVAWTTAASSESVVCYGDSPTTLSSRATGPTGTSHVVRVTGLTAGTRYSYAAGIGACPPATAGSAEDYFDTSPLPGARAPFKVWLLGDSGNGSAAQTAVRDAMLSYTGTARPQLLVHVGDMAYNSGTTAEFTSRFFAPYAAILRHTPTWAAIGNHEGTSSDSASQTGPYYDAYVLPTAAEAGGLASGTEAYYAFDYGNVHFVVLDSFETSRSPTGAMAMWLTMDLAATTQEWIVAFFHHGPYTKGTHDSDTEIAHIQMRENILPILEAAGVDAVLAGHSHIYERTYLVHGAYDTPTTAAGRIVDSGDGQLGGDGAYVADGTGHLYVTAGHGGASVGRSAVHPLMFFTEPLHGSCIVEVDGGSLTLTNVRSDGAITDTVTLVKPAALRLIVPRGGETFRAGSSVDVTWSRAGTTAVNVSLEVSIDGGAWSSIVASTPNDGTHAWVTPLVATTRARVRITDVADAANTDTSGDFTLTVDPSDGGVPLADLGTADLGTSDLGRFDLGAGSDAGFTPPARVEGGCDCRAAGHGRHGGSFGWVLALLLLGAVWGRRNRSRVTSMCTAMTISISCLAAAACGDDGPASAHDGGDAADAGVSGDAGPAIVRTRTPVGRLRAEGNEIVDADDHAVALRGVNLGAWLFVETWMDTLDYPPAGRLVVEADRLDGTLGADVRAAVTAAGGPVDETRDAYFTRVRAELPAGGDASAFDLAAAAALACADVADDSDLPLRIALTERFGAAGRDRVLDAYADAWITTTDLDAIAERGLNLVRVPTTWRGWVVDETSLDPIVLREATVARVEALLDQCEARGIYAVIDLQESPGGHNTYSGPARLYEDPASQTATIALWRAIAARLRDRDSVAAYSLLAEPFGAPDVPTMVAMYDRLHDALRGDGDSHLLVIHDGFKGVDLLPTPVEQGWTNVVYSSHYFEFGATSAGAVDFASRVGERQVAELRARGGVPFFVGSFSPIVDAPWAYDAFDLLTERYARNGWSWSLWSWKRIDDPLERELFGTMTAWGVWRSFEATTPVPRVDLCHDDEATILAKLPVLRTENLAPNATLDAHLRAAVLLP